MSVENVIPNSTSVPDLTEGTIVDPNGLLLNTIRSGRDAIQKGHFALGSDHYVAEAWTADKGWVISPPTLKQGTSDASTIIGLWVGYRERNQIISIGGRITMPGNEGSKPLCELEVAKMQRKDDETEAEIEQHALYAMEIDGEERSEAFLTGGYTDFTDFEVITTFINLCSRQQTPSIHQAITDMIGDIMERSRSGNLREATLRTTPTGTSIAFRQHSTTRYLRSDPMDA